MSQQGSLVLQCSLLGAAHEQTEDDVQTCVHKAEENHQRTIVMTDDEEWE